MSQFEILHFLADGRVGGPQVRIVRVHTAMKDLGCPVKTIVACPPTQPSGHFDKPEMLQIVMQWHKPQAEQPVISGLKWLFLGLWQDVATCRRIMRTFPKAIVHVNGAILVAAALAAIFEGRRWIWHLNDTSVPRFIAVIVRILLALGGGKAIASSSSVIDYYNLKKSTTVMYPPVELQKIKDRNIFNGKNIRLGVMANLSPGKGIEDVIEAFAVAHRTNTNLCLFIAGRILENKRWYFESLQKQIKAHDLEGKVEFSGFVKTPLEWMQSLDLFVFSSYSEAAPLALIDAMACGLPIVCGDIPPTREILGGCGLLVKLGETNSMATAILDIVKNNEFRLQLMEKALTRAHTVFSIRVIAEQYYKLYSNLLNQEGCYDYFRN